MPPRDYTMDTHGPASLRGVMGPSCPFPVGKPLPGLGVLLTPGVPVGIGTGSDIAWDDSVVDGVLASPSLIPASAMTTFSDVVDAEAPGSCSSWAGVMGGTPDRDRSSEVLALSAADALARSSDVRILSIDALPASTWAGGSRRGSLDLLSSEASFGSPSTSSFNCSQSSGSSTSASRSAAARQFGQMKIG